MPCGWNSNSNWQNQKTAYLAEAGTSYAARCSIHWGIVYVQHVFWTGTAILTLHLGRALGQEREEAAEKAPQWLGTRTPGLQEYLDSSHHWTIKSKVSPIVTFRMFSSRDLACNFVQWLDLWPVSLSHLYSLYIYTCVYIYIYTYIFMYVYVWFMIHTYCIMYIHICKWKINKSVHR